ncbi:BnaC02g26180D [Brassica napus]|uniref:(rape) hypothetical protein n=1 Tax=Brassica napus TaxID=3708 RepID=A0A078H9P4_BRANA|nr:unnamed protein product [Brassica napus]CDY33538.1 BnaC02g26180D [Brassica napus]
MHSPPFPSLHVLLVFTPSLESKPYPSMYHVFSSHRIRSMENVSRRRNLHILFFLWSRQRRGESESSATFYFPNHLTSFHDALTTFPFSPCSSCVHTIAGEQAISIDVPCFQFTSDPFHGEREQKEKVRRECCVSEPSITDLHCHEPLVTGDLHHVTGDQDASIVAMSEKVKCIISCFL